MPIKKEKLKTFKNECIVSKSATGQKMASLLCTHDLMGCRLYAHACNQTKHGFEICVYITPNTSSIFPVQWWRRTPKRIKVSSATTHAGKDHCTISTYHHWHVYRWWSIILPYAFTTHWRHIWGTSKNHSWRTCATIWQIKCYTFYSSPSIKDSERKRREQVSDGDKKYIITLGPEHHPPIYIQDCL